ncbi:MAG TPA: hypothetical protein VGB18_02370, partial [Candidatus Thermoplasmatota archaeon]
MNRLFLLLTSLVFLSPFVPTAGAQLKDTPTYHLDDATGDVAFTVVTGVASPGLPSAGHLTYVDFTSFSADDVDPLTLRVKMSTVAGFQPRTEQAVIFGFPVYYSFLFQIPGTEATPAYGVLTVYGYWDDTGAGSSPVIVGSAQFCMNTFYQDSNYCGYAGTLQIEPQYEDGTLILDLPKTQLTRSGQFAQVFPQLPG